MSPVLAQRQKTSPDFVVSASPRSAISVEAPWVSNRLVERGAIERSDELRVEGHAAVDDDRRSGDVSGRGARQPGDRAGHLLHVAHPPERNLCLDGVLFLGAVSYTHLRAHETVL